MDITKVDKEEETCPNPDCIESSIRTQNDQVGLPYFQEVTYVSYMHCSTCGIRGPLVEHKSGSNQINNMMSAGILWDNLFERG